ncbi:2-amino-4-hydroxy-6-hydroxymethyldihydropteridine diphosphokinase [Homoserinibacter sp. YIM 151385]|uniref:2-amino-4-hydroxy-6- hydroxymethyldihydropteridine diphosphokinase n=1 Tax=Homoserinibacter sp. YIM 151385 TaxID=2985506 RepID=UPI0022F0D59E|nr:2-amino-4-hydroxy-6-hydroxymethyldihydropteridine diphosphokinase [Homoserinibacter sp. YIM 151385]WBU37553.1 2-amino-4-hydroxy-6-hydroxymethyldihydropteridine diphosphokinase [Homoserinibacter sp. YIM 151385]
MTGEREAVIALGANLGDREATIRAALAELDRADGLRILDVSPLAETAALTPRGVDPGKPAYLNAVAIAATALAPLELLDVLAAVETAHGRVRAERWGDRTLDLDLVQLEGVELDTERLTLPHPRAAERDFVLGPWAAVRPDAVLAGHGPVAELLAGLSAGSRP